jgi:tetratricopeptide (TPR) repeat protein
MNGVLESIRTRAEALEHTGELEEAMKLWQLLARSASGDGVAMVAKSRTQKLARRLEDRKRAREILDRGDDAVRAAVHEAERNGRAGLILEIRRLQLAGERSAATLTALAAALRRAGEPGQAHRLVDEAIAIDPRKDSNCAAYVVLAALHRDRGRLKEARTLLEELRRIAPGRSYVASALAAVYLDYVEHYGQTSLLDPARKLIGSAYAQRQNGADLGALYGRLAALERKLGVG